MVEPPKRRSRLALVTTYSTACRGDRARSVVFSGKICFGPADLARLIGSPAPCIAHLTGMVYTLKSSRAQNLLNPCPNLCQTYLSLTGNTPDG